MMLVGRSMTLALRYASVRQGHNRAHSYITLGLHEYLIGGEYLETRTCDHLSKHVEASLLQRLCSNTDSS